MNRCFSFHRRRFIRCSSTSRSCCKSADTIDPMLHPTLRRFIHCWRLHDQNLTVLNFIAIGWTDVRSVGSYGATRRYTRASLSCTREPPDRPTMPSNGPSVHPTLLTSMLCLFYSSDACGKWIVNSSDGANWLKPLHSVPSTLTLASRVLSVHLTVSFLCFLASFTCFFASFDCGCIHGTKICLQGHAGQSG
jgi:hypothetical protein